MKEISDVVGNYTRSSLDLLGRTRTVGEVFGSSRPANSSDNPFKKQRGGERNLTAISKLVQSDPKGARELCRAAGEPESAWFGDNPR